MRTVRPPEVHGGSTLADHCHNLAHARDGLIVHLTYEGVTTPYFVGGPSGNTPE